MKLSKFVKRAKSESYCMVIHADDSGIWLGTRLALYNATELPEMEGKEQVGAVLDIDGKAWEKMFFDEKYAETAGAAFGVNLTDADPLEQEARRVPLEMFYKGMGLVGLMYGNAGELIFYDSALIAPIADVVKNSDYIQTVVRKAAKRLQYWMCQVQRKPGPGWYCLKLDISKYFYRVNHEKLLAILGRRVKDPAMMAFIRGVVNSRAEPFGLPRWRTPQDTPPEEWLYEVGMPIGNLTSQLFANIYLNELDQYCKHRLKIHYYIRYMDDVIILGQDKETLHRWKAAVETFLREELALDLNSKTSIRPVRQGVEFVGVRIWPTHMKLRKSTVRRIKREVRKISALYAAGDMTRQNFYRRIASIRGLLKHTESASLRWRLNEIYRAELEKAKQKQLREEAQHEPFADHSGAGNGDGNAGTGYQDHGNPACRAG